MTPKGHGVIRGRRDLLYDLKGHGDLCGRFDLVYDPQKVTGSLELAVTYFMTPNVTVTIVVSLTLFMAQKGHKVIRARSDLLDYPKGRGDLCGWCDLIYDPQKVTGSLEVIVTYFMTPKVIIFSKYDGYHDK